MMAFQMPCGRNGKPLTSVINWSIWIRGCMGADKVARMAIYNNARLVSQLYGQPVGSITPGAQADLIIVDYQPFTEITPDNLPWHIVFGFHESMIQTTLVAGKVLMKEHKVLTLDEHAASLRKPCECQKKSGKAIK